VDAGCAGCRRQRGQLFVYLRVVFHGARAERVETVVHAEVVGRMVGVVAHHGKLVALGQLGFLGAERGRLYLVVAELVLWQAHGSPARLRQLEYQLVV